jgi:hypothetical protein
MIANGDALRASAAEHDRAAAESFERCDTDGFVSQWASGVMGAKDREAADLADAGGVAEFWAVFDLSGNLLPYRPVQGRHGRFWVTDGDGPNLNESNSVKGWVHENTLNARRGVFFGTVTAPGRVTLSGGSGTGLGGALNVRPITVPVEREYWRECEVIDNGLVAVEWDVVRARVACYGFSRHEEREHPGRVDAMTAREFERRAQLADERGTRS